MQPSSVALRETMRAKTDEELYLILHVHSQDYTLEAIGAAQDELSQRQKREPTSRREKMLSHALALEEMTLEERDARQDSSEQRAGSDAKGKMPGWNWNDSDLKETATGWGCLILLFFVGYAIYGGYEWLDTMGWISHREDTVITAGSSWLVGESKECWSAPLNAEGAAQSGKPIGYAMSSVTCDDGPDHSMKVTFYGRKVQAEYKAVSWRCTRNEVSFLNDNSFTCYQTGGQR
jgi:hypothetical protein